MSQQNIQFNIRLQRKNFSECDKDKNSERELFINVKTLEDIRAEKRNEIAVQVNC